LPTPREQRLLSEFEEFAAGRSTACTIAAAQVGIKTAWDSRNDGRALHAERQLRHAGLTTDPIVLMYCDLIARRNQAAGPTG